MATQAPYVVSESGSGSSAEPQQSHFEKWLDSALDWTREHKKQIAIGCCVVAIGSAAVLTAGAFSAGGALLIKSAAFLHAPTLKAAQPLVALSAKCVAQAVGAVFTTYGASQSGVPKCPLDTMIF